MKILVDFKLSTEEENLLLGSNISYRPDLGAKAASALRAALVQLRPEVLICRRSFDDESLLAAWRKSMPRGVTPVLIQLGEQYGAESAIRAGVKRYGLNASAVVDAFLLTEQISTGLLDTRIGRPLLPSLTTKTPAHSGQVILVGAGIVNLVTAYYLSRQGYRLDIYDLGADPLAETSEPPSSCTFGGDDARIFSLNETRHHHFRGLAVDESTNTQFQRDVSRDGWLCCRPESLSAIDATWIGEFEATPLWLARQFDADIISFNKESYPLWREMMTQTPALFADVGFHDRLVRVYQNVERFQNAVQREQQIGAVLRGLPLHELQERLPSLAPAVQAQEIIGALEVVGFSVNVHKFSHKLIAYLVANGARFHWRTRVSQIVKDESGVVRGLRIGDEDVRADHYVVSPGAFGNELLKGSHTHNKMAAVVGMWLTLPNTAPALDCPLKISRDGYAARESAEGANVIPGVDADGNDVIYLSSGHGFLGANPDNLDPMYLAALGQAVEETAARIFPDKYRKAQERGWLQQPKRYCIRPWTPSGLGIFETNDATHGKLIVTGGHNTGGFAQSPSVAQAVAAAMQGAPHPMHRLYHPRRLSQFLGLRDHSSNPSQPASSWREHINVEHYAPVSGLMRGRQ